MRYYLTGLTLFAMLPMMTVLAAPAPPPSAILAIGPSPVSTKTDEQYRKRRRESQTDPIGLNWVLSDPEVSKLPSIASMKNALPWLEKNLRVTAEDEGRRLRFKFRAGSRAEQVAILNAILRANLAVHKRHYQNEDISHGSTRKEHGIENGLGFFRIFSVLIRG